LHPSSNRIQRYVSEPGCMHATNETSAVRTTPEAGRAARREAPRSAVANWQPPATRTDPVAILAAQDADRVGGLVPLRHARMAVSAFTFYRGAAAVMAADLAGVPTSGLSVQLCGDAHLSNLGVFASPSRELLFDLNDFDETLPGPWEWDLLRLATSFTIAGRDHQLPDAAIRDLTGTVVAAYRTTMGDLAGQSPLDIWYARLDTAQLRDALASKRKGAARQVDKGIAAARRRTSLQATRRLTETIDGHRRFRADPPVLIPLEQLTDDIEPDQLAAAIRTTFIDYADSLPDAHATLLRRYRIVDIAHKVVGVGSVGMRALVILLESDAGDPLVLQFKEAGPSVLESHLAPSPYEHHGQRVVEGQRMMQAASDIFLGWSTSALDGRHYYWRQLRDMKGSADLETMTPRGLRVYARMCGWSLARAHARWGQPAAIAAYLGRSDRYDRAAVAFAERYADLNASDYARHAEAIADGSLPCVDLS
jgi:uncharacterized protein (DUF2252 family)